MTCPPPDSLSEDDFDFDDDYDRYAYETKTKPFERKPQTEDKLKDAIEYGNLEEVIDIIKNDLQGNVNAKFDNGWTPLSLACYYLQQNIVEYLLDNGADIKSDKLSFQPLLMACTSTSEDEKVAHNIVSKLIKHKALVNVSAENGETPLMRATTIGRASLVKLLIDNKCNIEMRDPSGWTAVYYAIHHNKAKCLQILLYNGARMDIIDINKRSPRNIAETHCHKEINDVLAEYSHLDELEPTFNGNTHDDLSCVLNNYTRWQEFYPGLRDESRPEYENEIPLLLYGMNSNRMYEIFKENPIALRDFLLLEDDDMKKLGIDMPFDRQRLKVGLKKFHMKNWKVKAVAGLDNIGKTYNILDCVHTLGTHRQQLYILEATLMYIARDFNRSQNEMKSEPPDSPTLQKLQQAAQKVAKGINNIRREIDAMKKVHDQISKDSLTPVDFITEQSTKDIAIEFLTKTAVFTSLGIALYYARKYVFSALIK